MIVYIAIFVLLLLPGLGVESRKLSLYLSFLAALFLLLFMGTRYETGCDFYGYLRRFEDLDVNSAFVKGVTFTEPGFYMISFVIKKLGLDYMWSNVATSLIYLVCLVRFSRICRKPLLLLALFFPILIIQLGMSGVRQALAVGFLLLAYVEFTRARNLGTAFWILVAAQFHASAYLFIPLAWLPGRKVSVRQITYALAILGPIAFYFLQERLQVYSDRYIEQIYGESSSSGAIFRYIVILVPAVLFMYFRRELKAAFPVTYELMWLFTLITFALLPMMLVSTLALHRLTYYVMPVSLLMLINISIFLSKTRPYYIHPLAIPVVLMSIYMLGWFSMSRHASLCYVPYESYLF